LEGLQIFGVAKPTGIPVGFQSQFEPFEWHRNT